MALIISLKPDEVITVTGTPVSLSRTELKKYIVPLGHKLVRTGSSAFTCLVAANQPSPADIAKAKSKDATILTERQFLDRLQATDLMEKLKKEACDPTTSKKRLCQLAAVVPEAVAQNPLWQILHLENPNFLAKEEGLLKLRILVLATADLLDVVVESSQDAEISVDVLEVYRGRFEESDEMDLSHSINLNDFEVTLYCHDCDAEMEDVGQCDERLSIGDCIKAYLLTPFDDLREIAEHCGIEYEPSMSPRDGSPLRFGGVNIESEEELLEYEWGSFPDDRSLIAKLVDAGEGLYRGVSINEVGHRRPLFSSSPVANDDSSHEGFITVKWVCDCFVPEGHVGEAEVCWRKAEIEEEIEFQGSNMDVDYTLHYKMDFPAELESHIVRDLRNSSAASDAINACLLSVLGLRSDDLTD